MRFIQFSTLLLLSICQATGSEYADAVRKSELERFELDYIIEEYPEVSYNGVVEFNQGEQISLSYTLSNHEDTDIVVIGLGGAFRNAVNGESIANLTSTSVGPIVVPPGESSVIHQKLITHISGGNYLLSPQVFVAFNDEVKVIQARSQLSIVKETYLSFFNPQLLFLECLFLVIAGLCFYFSVPNMFKRNQINKSPVTKKPSNSSVFDPSWVPSHHQLTQRKSKTRKAY